MVFGVVLVADLITHFGDYSGAAIDWFYFPTAVALVVAAWDYHVTMQREQVPMVAVAARAP